MISEGESDLVLTKVENALLEQIIDRMFEKVAECRDAVGHGKGGYWADYAGGMAAGRGILVEAASFRSILMNARKLNAEIFVSLPLDPDVGEVASHIATPRARRNRARNTERSVKHAPRRDDEVDEPHHGSRDEPR